MKKTKLLMIPVLSILLLASASPAASAQDSSRETGGEPPAKLQCGRPVANYSLGVEPDDLVRYLLQRKCGGTLSRVTIELSGNGMLATGLCSD